MPTGGATRTARATRDERLWMPTAAFPTAPTRKKQHQSWVSKSPSKCDRQQWPKNDDFETDNARVDSSSRSRKCRDGVASRHVFLHRQVPGHSDESRPFLSRSDFSPSRPVNRSSTFISHQTEHVTMDVVKDTVRDTWRNLKSMNAREVCVWPVNCL